MCCVEKFNNGLYFGIILIVGVTDQILIDFLNNNYTKAGTC